MRTVVFACSIYYYYNFHCQSNVNGLVFVTPLITNIHTRKQTNFVCRITNEGRVRSITASLYQQGSDNYEADDDVPLEDALSDLFRLSSNVPKNRNASLLVSTDYEEIAAFQEEDDDDLLPKSESGNKSLDNTNNNLSGGVNEKTLRKARELLFDESSSPLLDAGKTNSLKNQKSDVGNDHKTRGLEDATNEEFRLKEAFQQASSQLPKLDSADKKGDLIYQQVFQDESDYLNLLQKRKKTSDSSFSENSIKNDDSVDTSDEDISQKKKMYLPYQKKKKQVLSQLERDIQEFQTNLMMNSDQKQETSSKSKQNDTGKTSKKQYFCDSCNCQLSQPEINHALERKSHIAGATPKMICHLCNAEKMESKNASPYNVVRIGIPEQHFQTPWERNQSNQKRKNVSSFSNPGVKAQGISKNKQSIYQTRQVPTNRNQKKKSEFYSASNKAKEKNKKIDEVNTDQTNINTNKRKEQETSLERQSKPKSRPVISMQDAGFNILEERKQNRLKEMREQEKNQTINQQESKIKSKPLTDKSSLEKMPTSLPRKSLNIEERNRYKHQIQQLNGQLQQALQMLRRERKKREMLERDLVSMKEIILDLEEALSNKATGELEVNLSTNTNGFEDEEKGDYVLDDDDFSDMVF